MSDFDVPIALILFNRPRRFAAVVAALREIRPRRIFAIADGPRPAHPEDARRCHDARGVLDSIDWPCEIQRDFAEENLGCDHRVRSGLDRLFERVDRAIILEDDVLPHPTFLPWAASMLERYGDDPNFSIASGCNKLGTWGDPTVDHLRAQRGGIWGWACTAQVWRGAHAFDLTAPEPQFDGVEGLEPLVARQCAMVVSEIRCGRKIAWDTEFCTRLQLSGRIAAISTSNLVSNLGIGADATRTDYADDFVATLPSRGVSGGPARGEVAPDPGYDRASLLAELLGRCVHPEVAVRLSRLAAAKPDVPIDEATRLHLEPFLVPDEARAVLDRLAAFGVASPKFERVRAAIRRAIEARSGSAP